MNAETENTKTTRNTLDYKTLKTAVNGSAAAIRVVTQLEPVGHQRDKVFPPTYAGGEYATEKRYPALDPKAEDQPLQSVLLHSVAGEANLLEEALKSAIQDGLLKVNGNEINVPLLQVSFNDTAAAEYVPEPITVLDAPHRVFDAIFRDSEIPGQRGASTLFKDTNAGKDIGKASLANATPLYQWSPTSLLFGCWNSANDKVQNKIPGNLKFARAIVSEIVGYGIVQGVRVGGKNDPVGITGQAIYKLPSEEETTDVKQAVHDSDGKPWYRSKDGNSWTQVESQARKETKNEKGKSKEVLFYRAVGSEWTTDEGQAAKNASGNPIKWGEKGKPSEVNLGQVTPTIGKSPDSKDAKDFKRHLPQYERHEELRRAGGGITMKYATQTTVLSLSALRRMRFPVNGQRTPEGDTAARTVLAALGLVAISAQRERDYFLRSRCELRAVNAPPFEFVPQGRDIKDSDRFTLSFEQAVTLLKEALDNTTNLSWKTSNDMPQLKPKTNLAELIRLSHERGGAEDEEQADPTSEQS